MEGYDYHSDFANVSKTMLSLYLKSPLEFHLTYNTQAMEPKGVGKPAVIGSIGHAVLLEGKRLCDIALVYPPSCLNKNDGLNSSPAAKFREECAGYYCLKPDEYAYIDNALNGMTKHADLMAIVENATSLEQPYFAEVAGVPCKCKPDILCAFDDGIFVYDPKFMENIDPDSFWRSAKRFSYHLQDSHYSAVLRKEFGQPVTFRFLAIETKFPYRKQWYFYQPNDRENAAGYHADLLRGLAERRESGNWEDDWKSEVSLGPWDMPGWDDDNAMVPFHEGDN